MQLRHGSILLLLLLSCGGDVSGEIEELIPTVDPTPALAIKKAYGDLQQARVGADSLISQARQDAHNALVSAAGGSVDRGARGTARCQLLRTDRGDGG